MKKFAFLLALIAILAMSACAFAATGVKELRTVNSAMNYQVNGKIAAGPAPGSDGDYCTKLYHIGPAAEEDEGDIVFDIELHAAAVGKYLKAVSPSSGYSLIETGTLGSETVYNNQFFRLPSPISTVAQYKIGIGDDDNPTLLDGAETKSLDVIPVQVEFDSTLEVSAAAGSTASLNIKEDFDDGNPGVLLNTLGGYGSSPADYVISYDDGGTAKSLTPGIAAVVGGLSLTYDPDTLTLAVKNDQPTPAASGTKVVLEIVTNYSGEVYIDEDGGLEWLNVAGIDDGVAIGTITIDVIDGGGDDPTPGPTPPAETVIDLIDEPENENASDKIKQAIRGGTTNFLLTLGGSDGRKIESVNGKTDDGADDVKALSGDKGQVQMRMAFLALDGSDGLKVADDAPDYINIVITNDGDGADSTASFDVTGYDGVLPDETVSVDKADGSASFSVGSKSTGGARSGFYTMSVISGRKLRTGGIAAAAKDGEVLASQKLRVDDGTQRRSSGGACDTGAGLAAAAGLAALALRKRSK